ncbi:MAG: hypothetical protein R3E02_11725 [Blastomonas sp.]
MTNPDRQDKLKKPDGVIWTAKLLAQGMASGVSDEKPETIIDNIISKRRARRG